MTVGKWNCTYFRSCMAAQTFAVFRNEALANLNTIVTNTSRKSVPHWELVANYSICWMTCNVRKSYHTVNKASLKIIHISLVDILCILRTRLGVDWFCNLWPNQTYNLCMTHKEHLKSSINNMHSTKNWWESKLIFFVWHWNESKNLPSLAVN